VTATLPATVTTTVPVAVATSTPTIIRTAASAISVIRAATATSGSPSAPATSTPARAHATAVIAATATAAATTVAATAAAVAAVLRGRWPLDFGSLRGQPEPHSKVLTRRRHQRLDGLQALSPSEPSADGRASSGVRRSLPRLHGGIGQVVGEAEDHVPSPDRRPGAIHQLDHQRLAERLAKGAALIVAPHDGERRRITGPRQCEICAAARDGR
jgi:hypothetical protein